MRNFFRTANSSQILQILIIFKLFTSAACLIFNNNIISSKNEICSSVAEDERVDCCPEGGAACTTASLCESRLGCCWHSSRHNGAPRCFFGRQNSNATTNGGYVLTKVEETSHGINSVLRRKAPSGRGADLDHLHFDISYETDSRLHIRFSDPQHKRFVAPFPKLATAENRLTNYLLKYRVKLSHRNEPFWFKILRHDESKSSSVLFDSSQTAPLIFTDQFIQLSGNLPLTSKNDVSLYGLGQHFTPFQLDFDWKSRFTFWNNDGISAQNVNLYGSQPFYMALVSSNDEDSTAEAHGVYFHNSGALEVALNPHGTVTWRAISGIIDLYVFLGPSPAQVVQQYAELVGRPAMPPYWALGFHLCRYGYGSLNRTRYINSINRAAGIPVEVQWNDIDALHAYEDFTYDRTNYSGLPQFVHELHRDGLKYIIMTDPGINAGLERGRYSPYDFGHELDIFVKNSTDQELIGESWTGPVTVWPDFSHPNALTYWTKMLRKFHKRVGFDALWIDMNEPSNFVSGSVDGCPANSSLEHPPYLPPLRHKGQLSANTLCMTAKMSAGLHYNLHNAYGLMEAEITYKALIKIQKRRRKHKKRPFVLTRSNFAGTGKWAAAWNGDGRATWTDLRLSIAYILNYNMFGIPFVGVDLCGFHTETTPDLCARWSQVGAFYPFVRNHNDLGLPDKDPASMGEPVLSAARQALVMRYRLLPYFYTLFYEAHTRGTTVARPLMFEFPTDSIARKCDWQFMIGNGLMIVPVLEPNVTKVAAYLPAEAEWYDFYTGEIIIQRNVTNETWAVFDAPYDKINLLQRSNTIVVEQEYANATSAARLLPFHIRVALPANAMCSQREANIVDDSSSRKCAEQELFWDDDGDLLDFSKHFNLIRFQACGCRLTISVLHRAHHKPNSPLVLESIRVSGLARAPQQVTLDNEPIGFAWTNGKVLFVENLTLNLLRKDFIVKYVY